jgi:uncharacterized repeat protein (TIGR03803 family)
MDGSGPDYGTLIRDSAGNLYGTTVAGGAAGNNGTVFKLGTAGAETVLYTFTGGADGGQPYAGLIRDRAGALYGTTFKGGITTGTCFQGGCGVVFKLDMTGAETVLHSFTGGADGGYPNAGLVRDSAGNLYGTALEGGIITGACGVGGCGVVFKLDTSGIETVLYRFTVSEEDVQYTAFAARNIRFVRKTRGLIRARAVWQVSDRARVRGSGRCGTRRIFSW